MKRIFYRATALSLALSTLLSGQIWAAESSSDSPAARTAHIEGRIEETASPDAKLPVRLTRLKAEQPILDTTPPLAPPLLHGGVKQLQSNITETNNLSTRAMQPEFDHNATASPMQGSETLLTSQISQESFSPDMMGFWAGKLTIVSEFHKPQVTVEPERQQGQAGVAIFHFIQDGYNTRLKPATVFLPPTIKALKNTRMSAEALEAMEQKAEVSGHPVDPDQMVKRNPIISLGSYDWVKLDGSHRTSTMTANTVHTLGPGVVEQDIVDRLEGQSAGQEDLSGYAEVVCRFTQTGSLTQFVQVAKINYATDRSINSRMVLEGTLSRNWQAYADAICEQLHRPWNTIVEKHNL